MNTIIKAMAPAIPQLDSLRSFRPGCRITEGGFFVRTKECDSDEQAQEYLNGVAFGYYKGNEAQIESNNKPGYLKLGTVTMFIDQE